MFRKVCCHGPQTGRLDGVNNDMPRLKRCWTGLQDPLWYNIVIKGLKAVVNVLLVLERGDMSNEAAK